LRSFVRFLVARGEVPAALRTCIPAVARLDRALGVLP